MTINCVITEANYKDLTKMIDIAKETGTISLSYQHLMFSDPIVGDAAIGDTSD